MRILDTGEHYANLIIENRPCDGLSGLPRVPAIGSSHYENFRVWVNVECWNGY
jgi:hypothetical protein